MKYDKDVYIDDDNKLKKIIDLIIKSNDLNTKKRLSDLVIMSLINRVKAAYQIDFDVSYKIVNEDKSILGLYKRDEKTIYVNNSFMSSLHDFNEKFILCI